MSAKTVKRKRLRRPVMILAFVIAVAAVGAIVFSAVSSYKSARKHAEDAMYPRKYSEQVEKASAEFGIECARIYAVILTESSFRADAQSKSDPPAIGLMQILPTTYEWICEKRKIDCDPEKIYDPGSNIDCGAWFLAWLYDYYDGDWRAVHAAYNAGPGRVNQWIGDGEKLENIPNQSVSAYVDKVDRLYNKYSQLLQEERNNE